MSQESIRKMFVPENRKALKDRWGEGRGLLFTVPRVYKAHVSPMRITHQTHPARVI